MGKITVFICDVCGKTLEDCWVKKPTSWYSLIITRDEVLHNFLACDACFSFPAKPSKLKILLDRLKSKLRRI